VRERTGSNMSIDPLPQRSFNHLQSLGLPTSLSPVTSNSSARSCTSPAQRADSAHSAQADAPVSRGLTTMGELVRLPPKNVLALRSTSRSPVGGRGGGVVGGGVVTNARHAYDGFTTMLPPLDQGAPRG